MNGVSEQRHEPNRYTKNRPQIRRCRVCGSMVPEATRILHHGRLCSPCERRLTELATYADELPTLALAGR